MKILSKESFIWINVFVSLLSLLLCIFFFQKVYKPNVELAESFSDSSCIIKSSSIGQKASFGPCSSVGVWWFVSFKDAYVKYMSSQGVTPDTQPTRVTDDLADNDSSGFSNCYQGVLSVAFSDGDSQYQLSNITGLYSANLTWVIEYMNTLYNGKSSLPCYYKSSNPFWVLPFKPSVSSAGKVWGSIFLVILILSFLLVVVLFIWKQSDKRKKRARFQFKIPNRNVNSNLKQDILESTINFQGLEISLSTSTNQKATIQNNNTNNKIKKIKSIKLDNDIIDDDDSDNSDDNSNQALL
ncbi:hypothetical protein DLAC_06218 [Tieghemostelium lacteum]|uniref:Transmembrane protein n=1 Tax=Tieghemostelium lacteum TaxID=361077 RepID=A0A151ZHX7_TIELA|nr:hypothetical protein DLAC_06218 [Tieghemostelium lacteum]|eukprot:KYQ93517.1 hypothetical protein DLAC_06218 [Tieghemostelium lacteum]